MEIDGNEWKLMEMNGNVWKCMEMYSNNLFQPHFNLISIYFNLFRVIIKSNI